MQKRLCAYDWKLFKKDLIYGSKKAIKGPVVNAKKQYQSQNSSCTNSNRIIIKWLYIITGSIDTTNKTAIVLLNLLTIILLRINFFNIIPPNAHV